MEEGFFKGIVKAIDSTATALLKGIRNTTYKVKVENSIGIPEVSFDETNTLLVEIREEVKKKSESDIEIEIDRNEIKGDKGDKGDTGLDGIDGIDGKDGENGADGRDGIDGENGKDGSQIEPNKIVSKLESLKGDERLNVSAIKNIDNLIENTRQGIVSFIPKTFDHLLDAPNSYSGQSGKYVRVKTTENGLEFAAVSGGGAVDSVNGQIGVVVLDADDIDDTSTTQKFVTASDLTKLSNLSGTNSGDQTSIVGITGTKAQFDTALTDGDFLYVGDITPAGSDTEVQFNLGGVFGGSADFFWDYNNSFLSVTNSIHLGALGTQAITDSSGLSSDRTFTFPDNDGTFALTSDLSGFVASVSGTSNRITSTGGTTPVIDISASYVGQASITTLGTIATGTWSATAIAANKGGTGQTSYAVGDILYASTTSALSKLAGVAVGSYLRSGGVNTAPLWSTLILPNSATANRIAYATSTNTYGESSKLTYDGSIMTVQGSSTGKVILGGWSSAASYGGLSVNGLTGTSTNFYSDGGTLYINRPTGASIEFRENNGTTQVLIASGGNVSITGNFAIQPTAGGAVFTVKAPTTADFSNFIFYDSAVSNRGSFGYVGSAFGDAARNDHFEMKTAAGTSIYFRPGDIDNQVIMDSSGGVTAKGLIKSTGATAGIGYATGAGGAVTQATSKATGVTLNKVTGAITMNNAALAAATSVSFTLTNSAIAATDIIVLNIKSAATASSYTVDVEAVAAGSCAIHIRNVSAGSLSEALVLNFAVIKGVAS